MNRKYLHLASLTFVLSLSGCWEVTPDPNPVEAGSAGAPDAATSGQGGSTATGGAQTIGSTAIGGAETGGSTAIGTTESGGSTAIGTAETGGSTAIGTAETGGSTVIGTTEAGGSTAIGTAETGGSTASGTVETGGNTHTGGSTAIGGTQTGQSAGSPGTGGTPATGGSPINGSATGGAEPTGGTTSTGGAAQAGSGGVPEVLESICADEEGAPVPYDFSFGLVSEYAFELSMSCDVGGYLMPLVLADPEQLSQVNAFVAEATGWYRAEVLKCKDETTQLDQDSYGLLPVSQSSDLSEGDFDASMALFLMVIDRHDTQPDAVSAIKKDKIKNRIKSVKARAVHNPTVGLTKTLSEPDCVPAAPTGSGG